MSNIEGLSISGKINDLEAEDFDVDDNAKASIALIQTAATKSLICRATSSVNIVVEV